MTVAASFAGAVVLVTGVGRSGQVGEAVARAFGERGAHVALVDRDGASYVERETVADWVLWLCGSESGRITGQVFKLG